MNSQDQAYKIDPEDDPDLYETWLLEGLDAEERESAQTKLRGLPERLRAFDLVKGLPEFTPHVTLLPDNLPTFDEAITLWQQHHQTLGRDGVRVLLVQSPNQTDINSVGNASCYQPEGIWRIGSYVTSTIDSAEVLLADGTVLNIDEIMKIIADWEPDLVGVSVLTPTVIPAKKISEFAKATNAIVVWGNDHASQNALNTLSGRAFVDVVIRGDSTEKPFATLVKVLLGEEQMLNVESASWRVIGGIRTNPLVESRLAASGIPDLRLISSFDVYARNFNQLGMYGRWHDHRIVPAVTNFARGCHWGIRRCIYCDIIDLKPQRMGPNRVWEWIDMLHSHYGVNLIYEVCDNFTTFSIPDNKFLKRFGIAVKEQPSYLDRLLATRPPHLKDIEWFIYGRADDFTQHPELAAKLKQLGVVRVNIGLDHANDRMLNGALRKGNKLGVEANRRTVQLLAEHRIQGYFSMVIGVPGETKTSLGDVKQFVEWASDEMKGLIVCWDPSILLPLKGSPIWDVLTNQHLGDRYFGNLGVKMPHWAYDHFREKYDDFDNVDTQEITREAMALYCPEITYEDAENLVVWIYDLCRERGIVPGGYGIRGLTMGIGSSITKTE